MKLEKSRFFSISELVCPEILAVLTEEAAWRLIPYSAICGLDNLRRIHGAPIWINGKGLTQCGIRAKNTITGAPLSRHKLLDYEVTAFDLHADDLKKLRDVVMQHSQLCCITRMEDPESTPTWVHVELTTNLMVGALKIFKP